ncbi:hypothetical protein T484DRAFT_1906666 [Baffinella frigidus]|nr:hypothetical protein T484DRAFT_1906666 [Cryptophyta sp. CCMP2293]
MLYPAQSVSEGCSPKIGADEVNDEEEGEDPPPSPTGEELRDARCEQSEALCGQSAGSPKREERTKRHARDSPVTLRDVRESEGLRMVRLEAAPSELAADDAREKLSAVDGARAKVSDGAREKLSASAVDDAREKVSCVDDAREKLSAVEDAREKPPCVDGARETLAREDLLGEAFPGEARGTEDAVDDT